MTGRRVPDLERRLGVRGHEVLGLLREAAATAPIGPEQVEAIAARTAMPAAHVRGAASFYADFSPAGRSTGGLRVCTGTACFAAGGGERSHERLSALQASGELPRAEEVRCVGCCYAGPAALDGERICAGDDLLEQLRGAAERRDPPMISHNAAPEPIVLAGIAGGDGDDPWRIVEAVRAEGRAGRERVLAEVAESGLRGRGGGGFPVARKWRAAAEGPAPRYVIANGDEGDPGSYVDRLLMESDPQRLLAGVALAAIATGAERAYIYVRSEYPAARDRLRAAIAEARERGRLGGDLRAGGGLEIEVFKGAGSYVAGEETALIHSIEGLRGDVLPRPPFPAESGLLGTATTVNNVETLCSVPWIVERGGSAYARLGRAGESGTKVVCLNERFRRPGAYEVELGVSLRWIYDELGGGLQEGLTPGPVQIGGPLGGFLHPDRLDVPLGFSSLRELGVDLGHGSVVAFDDTVPAAELLRHVWRFAAAESCGACAPCRLGTRRGLQTALRDPDGGRRSERLGPLLETMAAGSMCAFGRSVPGVIESLLAATGPRAAAGAAAR